MKKKVFKILAGIILLSKLSSFDGMALDTNVLKNLNNPTLKLTELLGAVSVKPNFVPLNVNKENANSPFAGAKAGINLVRTINPSVIPGASCKVLGMDCVIQKISIEIGPELTVNEGSEKYKVFYKTICINGEFESQNSIEKIIVAKFIFKVTFNYDKKTFVKIAKPDGDVVCVAESFEEMLDYKNKIFNNFNLISCYEILPSTSLTNNIITVSLINMLYKNNENTGRKEINRRTHADVFCSENGEIGYNATKF